MSTDIDAIDYLATLSEFLKIEKILLILISITILIFISQGIKSFSERLYKNAPSKKTIILQFSTILTFFINIFGSFYIFYTILNPPREFLIAILGSITFASGLAIKDLVASVISGITIILNPPFNVGDRIRFKDIYGEIKHIGLRAVTLQNLDNQTITIPNQNFLNEAVLCANKGRVSINVVMNFYFSLKADIEKVQEILKEIVVTSKYAYLKEPIIMGLDQIWKADLLCYQLTLKAYALDASFEKDLQTDVISRANKAFIKAKIPLPI